MEISPINSMLAAVNVSQNKSEVLQKSKETVVNATTNVSSKNSHKIFGVASIIAGLAVLGAVGVYSHRVYKFRQLFENISNIFNELQNELRKHINIEPSVSVVDTVEKIKNVPKMLPVKSDSYVPLTISQRISQYKTNVSNFIAKECSTVVDRGVVKTLSMEKFHRWNNAAKRLGNVTQQAVSDTYKSFKICLNTFKERYGLQDKEIGFIKESMNMFSDRIRMAVIAKENVDTRILKKQITPEQLFAEKISEAFVPSMETSNDVVLNKLFNKVSEVINF